MQRGDFLENIEDTIARARILGGVKPAAAQQGFFMAFRRGVHSEYPDPSTCALDPKESGKLAKRARGRGQVTRIVEFKAYIVRDVP